MATICKGCEKEVMRARWVEKVGWFCHDCVPEVKAITNVSGSMFPFTTSHLNQRMPEKITVRSLRHLRRLENEYGVGSVAFNQEERHWNRPTKRDFKEGVQ